MAGMQISKFYFGFRIPKPWILDSTDQKYLDSGLLTWGEQSVFVILIHWIVIYRLKL